MKLGQQQTGSPGSSDLARTIQVVLKDFRYGVDDEVFAIEVASYKRILKGVKPIELLDAFQAHQENPAKYDRNGYLLKPFAVALRARVMRQRYLHEPPKELPAPTPRPAPTAEQAQRARDVMNAAGFTHENAELLKRFPKAGSIDEAREADRRVAGKCHWSRGLAADDPRMVAMRKGREAYRITPAQLKARDVEA